MGIDVNNGRPRVRHDVGQRRAAVDVGANGREEQFPLQGVLWRKVLDGHHIDQLVELLNNLLKWCRFGVHDNGDPREAGLRFRGCHSE